MKEGYMLNQNTSPKPKFKLGRVVMTRAVAHELVEHHEGSKFAYTCLLRHATADWGELEQDDYEANEEALAIGETRILSSYEIPNDVASGCQPPHRKLWIITEWDRSATTILFPEDY